MRSSIAPERGEYLIALDTRLSTIVRIFSASPMTSAGFNFASNEIIRASAASFCSRSTRTTTSDSAIGPSVTGSIARV